MNEKTVGTQSAQAHPAMEINVKIYPPRKNDPALAAASVCLNGCFVVRGIRVVEGSSGPFVSMPSRQIKSGGKNIGYKDTCFACTEAFRQQLDSAVLDAYRQHMAQEQTVPAPEAPAPADQAEQEVIV